MLYRTSERMTWATPWFDAMIPLISVLGPLVGVPLTLITFYLRSMREHQVAWHAEQVRRLDAVELAVRELRQAIREFERDYTSKEEWLRECMQTRQILNRLSDAVVHRSTRQTSPARYEAVRAGEDSDNAQNRDRGAGGAVGDRD